MMLMSLPFPDSLQIAELLSYIITILGLPFAILLYYKEQCRQRLEREFGTYDALDENTLNCSNSVFSMCRWMSVILHWKIRKH